MKKNFKYIKTGLTAAVLAGTTFAEVTPVTQPIDSSSLSELAGAVSRLKSKAGIHFGGDFISRGIANPITGPLIDSTKAKKTREDIMFTALDLNITMGPHSGLQGKADLRLHQDWRNMFGSYATPLSVHWLSIDGNGKDMFFYNAGDFKQKFTPLTLWAPEPEIMYEPYIFARQRKIVMDEVYAGNNQRVLQGANFMFAAKMWPVFEEVTSKSYFARNRKAGKEDNFIRPENIDYANVKMDRYTAGENLFFKIRKDAELGASFIYTGDAFATHKMGGDKPQNKKDLDKSLVLGVTAAIGTGLIKALDTNKLNVRIDADVAYSIYQTYTVETSVKEKPFITPADSLEYKAIQNSKKGLGLNAVLGVKAGIGSLGSSKLDLGFIYTDPKFTNEMAQSPIFYNRQILNTGVKGARSSFDGLYKSVFNYTPAEYEFKLKEPQSKIAWTRGILTPEELAELEIRDLDTNMILSLDRTFSSILPYGKATPNRKGLDIDFTVDLLEKAILLSADVKLLKTTKPFFMAGNKDTTIVSGKMKDPTIVLDTIKKYTSDMKQFSAGASFDVAQFGDWWSYPLVLSGSFSHVESSVKRIDTDVEIYKLAIGSPQFFGGTLKGVSEINDLVNASLYWKFWKRAAIMGGAQLLMTNAKGIDGESVKKAHETNFAGGLEYSVTEGGLLSFTAGQVTKVNKLKVADKEVDKSRDFSTMQYDLLLTVKF